MLCSNSVILYCAANIYSCYLTILISDRLKFDPRAALLIGIVIVVN